MLVVKQQKVNTAPNWADSSWVTAEVVSVLASNGNPYELRFKAGRKQIKLVVPNSADGYKLLAKLAYICDPGSLGQIVTLSWLIGKTVKIQIQYNKITKITKT